MRIVGMRSASGAWKRNPRRPHGGQQPPRWPGGLVVLPVPDQMPAMQMQKVFPRVGPSGVRTMFAARVVRGEDGL